MKIQSLFILIFAVLVTNCQQNQLYKGYLGLQPAQIPQSDLAGIDLYLDILFKFASTCILIALGIPIVKLETVRTLFGD